MNFLGWKQLSIAAMIGLMASSYNMAQAACNDVNTWFKAPGPEIKLFIGYEQEQKSGFGDFGVVQ